MKPALLLAIARFHARQGGSAPWRFLTRVIAGPKSRPVRGMRDGARFLQPEFVAAHAETLAHVDQFIGRDGFVKFATLVYRGWMVDAMAQWGIEFRDPSGDRALIEYILTLPPEAIFAGGMARGLARAMGEGRVPDSVRFRPTRGEQVPELPAIVLAHRAFYRDTLERTACSPLARSIVNVPALREGLARQTAGIEGLVLAHTITRVLDVGLFIAEADR